jgi:2-dehydro-3-deoxygluconokinase
MASPLAIRRDGALDLLALGAMVTRLDPGIVPFHEATSYEVHVSGGEFNVAANAAAAFGLRTGIASAMVDYPIGRLVEERVRAMGVSPFYRRFEHDGVTGPNIAIVYSDRPVGVRAPVVFYNRSNEAAARLAPGDFDWATIFGAGVRWFHTGGIFAALSPSAAELIVEAMDAAREAGAVVSFDVNFRPGLWHAHGGPAKAAPVLRQIVERVDVLMAGEADIQALLGVEGPEPAKGFAPGDRHNPHSRSLDATAFFSTAAAAARAYPRLRVVASPRRQVLSASRHRWSAVAWVGGEEVRAPDLDLDVYDRVGTGDALAAGLFAGLLGGESPDAALRLGWAHGALVSTFPGDTTMATLDEVRALAAGESATIQR